MSSNSESLWTDVEQYITGVLLPADRALTEALEACAAAGLPSIQVSPNQGKFLQMLAMMRGARNILEVGTLGGYSTIWLARALPAGGRLITLEVDAARAEVARRNIANAGLGDRVELRVGPALETLPQLAGEGLEPFDLVFIDADKPSNPEYFQWALKLSRAGTLIVIDNVVREGKVLDASSDEPAIEGVRRMNELIAAEPRVTATTLQTVGSKGYDGMTFALVLAE